MVGDFTLVILFIYYLYYSIIIRSASVIILLTLNDPVIVATIVGDFTFVKMQVI